MVESGILKARSVASETIPLQNDVLREAFRPRLQQSAQHSSEDGALGAALGTHVLLELILVNGLPRDDHAEEVVPDSVVGGGNHVAFLAATSVHHSECLLSQHAGLLTAQAVQLVDTSSRERAGGRSPGQSGGDGTARVGDERADHTSLVRVRLLEQSDANELMWGHEVIEELLDVVGEAIPVTVSAVNELGEGFGSCLL